VFIKFFDLQIDNNLYFKNALNILSSKFVKHALPSGQELCIYIPLCHAELLSGTFNSYKCLPSKRKLLD